MKQELKTEIMKIVREYVPDAVESADEYDWDFGDRCRCYSEWTTESCYLRVGVVSPTVDRIDYKLVERIEHAINKWADDGGVSWDGCECCGNALYVDVRFYNTQQTR